MDTGATCNDDPSYPTSFQIHSGRRHTAGLARTLYRAGPTAAASAGVRRAQPGRRTDARGAEGAVEQVPTVPRAGVEARSVSHGERRLPHLLPGARGIPETASGSGQEPGVLPRVRSGEPGG